jgi:hypothetical protein
VIRLQRSLYGTSMPCEAPSTSSKTAVTWGSVPAFQLVSSTPMNGLEMTLAPLMTGSDLLQFSDFLLKEGDVLAQFAGHQKIIGTLVAKRPRTMVEAEHGGSEEIDRTAR